ncbi:MAG: AAA family ATPase, partial [Actinobacteria bacterium]|nr:AAA family ATPase [Actinomycetota bacterium]
MATHPELAAEQAFVDHAYEGLEESRRRARRLLQMRSLGPGGTHQARLENDVFEETARARRVQLELGDVALVFGRI